MFCQLYHALRDALQAYFHCTQSKHNGKLSLCGHFNVSPSPLYVNIAMWRHGVNIWVATDTWKQSETEKKRAEQKTLSDGAMRSKALMLCLLFVPECWRVRLFTCLSDYEAPSLWFGADVWTLQESKYASCKYLLAEHSKALDPICDIFLHANVRFCLPHWLI